MAASRQSLSPILQQFLHEESCASSGLVEEESSLHTLQGIVRELDVKGHELFKNFVSKVEMDVPIELLHEALHDCVGHLNLAVRLNPRDADANGHVTATERVVDGDISASEGPMLERFKVRTVNIPGAVEEDNK